MASYIRGIQLIVRKTDIARKIDKLMFVELQTAVMLPTAKLASNTSTSKTPKSSASIELQ